MGMVLLRSSVQLALRRSFNAGRRWRTLIEALPRLHYRSSFWVASSVFRHLTEVFGLLCLRNGG